MHISSDKATVIIAWYASFYKPVIIILIFAILPPSNHQTVAVLSIKSPNNNSKVLGDALNSIAKGKVT